MKQKLKIIIPAIVVVIVAIVGVILVVNNNQTEQVKGTTTEVVKTILKEDKATITEKVTTTENETGSTTETTTQTTNKVPSTTKKPITNSSGNSSSSNTTTKKTTTATSTTQKQENTTKKPNTTVNVNVMGEEQYGDTARAGLYYNNDGKLTTYDKIEDGEWYWYYNEYGNRERLQKPYSKGNEPKYNYDYCHKCGFCLIGSGYYDSQTCPSCKQFIGYNADWGRYCQYCGKNTADINGKPACTAGGCSRWISTLTCSDCGVEVPAHTCHTCKK